MALNLPEDFTTPSHLPDDHTSSVKIDLYKKDKKVTKAVIIAAGKGSRLQSHYSGCPKPLVKVGGVPLLMRVILAAKKIGVTEFVIVLGYQAARIRKTISSRKLGVKITWVRNTDWQKPNGLSVLKAEKYVDGNFLLFMSDHVFSPAILKNLKEVSLEKDYGLLCVDHRLNKVPNLDDATKVRTENKHLSNIGKSLTDFNAIDVGIFMCTPHLFEALRQSQLKGDYSLSGGVRILAEEGRMRTFDIGDHFWQDVDTEPDLRHAERLLLQSTRSSSDGIIAKLVNRRISTRITKWLLKTPITPNQISFFNLFFSIFIAWVISFGKPVTTMIAGILFQLASIIDGCDGEVAQIKLKDSKFGAFVDTFTDHVSYFFFIIGVTIGAYRASNDASLFYVTAVSLAYLIVALKIGVVYLKKKGSGTLRDLDQDIAAWNHNRQKVWYLKFFGVVHHLGRRDLFSFGGLLIMMWGSVQVFYWGLIGAVNLMSLGISVSAGVLLSQQHHFGVLSPIKKLFSISSNGYKESGVHLQSDTELGQ